MHTTILQKDILEVIKHMPDDFTHKIYIILEDELPNSDVDILIDYLYSLCKTSSVEIVITGNLYCNIVKLILHMRHVAEIVLLDSVRIKCNLLYKELSKDDLLIEIVASQLESSTIKDLYKKLL